MNDNFIAVKVDRDERPDIDSRYQAAVSSPSAGKADGRLTAFLTPDGKPFYGGTYFPPHDQWGRPSFKRVLISIANAYREKNADVAEQAKMVESAISHAESFAGKSATFSPAPDRRHREVGAQHVRPAEWRIRKRAQVSASRRVSIC